MTKKVLLIDILFPNKYAKWRLVTTKSFIDQYDTDILTLNKATHTDKIPFEFDYAELKNSHSLDQYDILIFNPAYNYINKYNSPDFDGKTFNRKYGGDYMFRKKKDRSSNLNIKKYEMVYHIFLCCYGSFNNMYSFPQSRQFIHLYPGGGFVNMNQINSINENVKIIATHYYTHNHLRNSHKHKFITVYCAPFFDKNDIIKHKNINDGTLKVCFTSLGDPKQKGAYTYIKIVDLYKNKYKDDNVMFYSIGVVPASKNVTHFVSFSQEELDKFYNENIDILFNLDTGISFNGFPLGSEGMAQGTILFTTDKQDFNKKCEYGYGDEMVIIDDQKLNDIVDKIHYLHMNRNVLNENSIKIQNKTYELFCYENTIGKIFKFIEDEMMNVDVVDVTKETDALLSKIPTDFIGGGNIQKKYWMIQHILNENLKCCVEIGVWKGRSYIPMVVSTQKLNGIAYGIDPYTSENMMEYDAPSQVMIALPKVIKTIKFDLEYNNVLKITNKYNNAIMIRATSENAVSMIKEPIDLLHIDGNHDTKFVAIDINLYASKVRQGGYIVMDDINWPSVQEALSLLDQYSVKINDFKEWGIWRRT
jgi:hypothetical protein